MFYETLDRTLCLIQFSVGFIVLFRATNGFGVAMTSAAARGDLLVV